MKLFLTLILAVCALDCPAGNSVTKMDSIYGCTFYPSTKTPKQHGLTVEMSTEIMNQDCDIIGFIHQPAFSAATNFKHTTLTTFLTKIKDYPSCVTPALNPNVALYLRSTQTPLGDIDECAGICPDECWEWTDGVCQLKDNAQELAGCAHKVKGWANSKCYIFKQS